VSSGALAPDKSVADKARERLATLREQTFRSEYKATHGHDYNAGTASTYEARKSGAAMADRKDQTSKLKGE